MNSISRKSPTKKSDVLTYPDFCALVIGLPARERTPEQQEKLKAWLEEQEQVRQRFIEVCSSSPLYRQRLEKNPDFWKDISVGGVRL
jgi:hypothetical protein